ncbi:MAG: nicotinate-nucleotide adenylyltransferase [Deltaproteobacteria bacterium]|nr:nicotinate-nucleotide adenylyltransferase [Deltaproteobacteria bacterium]MBW2069754.1 nicotinate-nucleotide adenylyltransferase [Deltaproteobacteria bacterium]
MKKGILGGTFNPVHFGHLRAAEEVAESLQLAEVVFMPAANPPHKDLHCLVSFSHRYAMLELAVAENPFFTLSDLERQLSGKSYSVETLTWLASHSPEEELLYFIVGLDAFLDLPSWRKYRQLFTLAHFVVVARPGYSHEQLESMLTAQISSDFVYDDHEGKFSHPHYLPVYYRQVTLMDISSSKIRQLLASGRSVRYLIPAAVEAYIYQHALYGSSGKS